MFIMTESKKKLMIVDDDPDILITVREIFEREGFEVYTVDCGKDCIKEIKEGFKGVILMDIMMPFMDGWDTIEKIKEDGLSKNVIISILSAKGTEESDKIKSFKDQIYAYYTKPFKVEVLISDIRKMIKDLK